MGGPVILRKSTVLVMSCIAAVVAHAGQVYVEWDSELGPVKPVNGVGQPPMVGGPSDFTMMHYLKEVGIPYSRLHDVGGLMGQGIWVDIPNVFPDFNRDENDPKNYLFDTTDALIKALSDSGVEPYFRLGVSIESFAGKGFRPRRTLPPADFSKWARVCEKIILHYNEGWANGQRTKISYWEIWNEPENYPEVEKNCMWKGDFASYIRFYGTVAPYLKGKFPQLKIGGYGSCGFYAGVKAELVAAANSSPRLEHFVVCAREFLSAVRGNGWPLDFFSFHSYSEAKDAVRQVRFADSLLNEYGFTADRTERHFNEWLPYVGRDSLGSNKQAAGVAAELIGLQNGPCDLACIYDARCTTSIYSPLFDPISYKPRKSYYAFVAFNELRKCGHAVKAVSTDVDLWVAAARGLEIGVVMIANDSEQEKSLSLDCNGADPTFCRITDAKSDDRRLNKIPTVMPPYSFAIVFYRLH